MSKPLNANAEVVLTFDETRRIAVNVAKLRGSCPNVGASEAD
jgi:hypothetical protein